MLLAIRFWFVQYLQCDQSSVHNGQSGCFSIESLQQARSNTNSRTQHINQSTPLCSSTIDRPCSSTQHNTNTIRIFTVSPIVHGVISVQKSSDVFLERLKLPDNSSDFLKQAIALNNTQYSKTAPHRSAVRSLTACCFSQETLFIP